VWLNLSYNFESLNSRRQRQGWQTQCLHEPQMFGTKRWRGTKWGPSPQPLCPSNPRVKPSLPKHHNADRQIPQAAAPLRLFTMNNTPNRLNSSAWNTYRTKTKEERIQQSQPFVFVAFLISAEKGKNKLKVSSILIFLRAELCLSSLWIYCILVWTEIKELCCFSSHSDINRACEVRLNYVFKVFILPIHFSECYVRMRAAVLIKLCLCLAFENTGFSLSASLKIVQKQNE